MGRIAQHERELEELGEDYRRKRAEIEQLTIMRAFAQLKRDTMIERTRAGLVAAAANGRKGGRPRKVGNADAEKARRLRERGISATDIGKMLGVSRATTYRYVVEGTPLDSSYDYALLRRIPPDKRSFVRAELRWAMVIDGSLVSQLIASS